MSMDPVTSTAFESLAAEILPALQKRLSELAGKPETDRICDEDTRHLVINTIDMLAMLRGWLGVPETAPAQKAAPPAPAQSAPQPRSLDAAALERLSVAISGIELDHFKLLSSTKALLSDPAFAGSPSIRKFAELTTGIVKSFGSLRASVDAVQRRTGPELASATQKLLSASGKNISAGMHFEQLSLDHPMVDPVATILADLISGVATKSLIQGRISAGMIRFVLTLDNGGSLPAAHAHTPWFKAAVDSARAVKGVITLDSTGSGAITFEVPASLRGIKGIVVRTGGEHYALPDYGIVETIRLDQSKVQTIDGQEFLNIQETSLPLLSLPKLLGRPDTSSAQIAGRYALIVQSRGQRCGLVVDELVQHRDLTLRPLGGALAARPEIFGGAIDADGKVIVVLDPREIGAPHSGG